MKLMWIKKIFLAVIGLSAGTMVAAGFFAFITAIGVVTTYAQRTKTAAYIKTYENTLAAGAILGNASLIRKIYVPKYLFVISRIFSSFINLMASFTALILVMVATRAELHWTVILVPIPLVLLVIFSMGIGLILSAIAVKFRDIMHLYSVFITALMYLTPIIYPMSILPAWLKPIVNLNPITNILLMFRDVMLDYTIFDAKSIIIAVIEAGLALVIGLRVFYKAQDEFILNI